MKKISMYKFLILEVDGMEPFTKIAWYVLEYTNHQQEIHGYQDNRKGEV